MSAVQAANIEAPAAPSDNAALPGAGVPNFENARALFVHEILSYINEDPEQTTKRRDEVMAQTLFYTQGLYEQLAQTMALVQSGGLGGIMKLLRGGK